jgi:multidrug efflux pump subunit AcrB
MLASYGISRTLTPIIIRLLLRGERDYQGPKNRLARFHDRFNEHFDRFRDFYAWLLTGILRHRVLTPLVAGSVVAGAVVVAMFVGSDFFPTIDAGLIELHVRAPARTRIEYTEQIFHAIEDNVRRQIPAKDLGLVLDNIGLPQRVYNLAYTDGSTIGANDGQIQIQLNEGHAPTADYIKKLRRELAVAFPDVLFYFQPADLATQVLNFGVPSQIDVQVVGRDRAANEKIANEMAKRLSTIPGIVDSHVQQELDAPELFYSIDRSRAQELGLSISQIANNMNISLSSSEQVSPNFWSDPKNGIPYYFAVQTPEYRISDKQQLDNTLVAASLSGSAVVPDLLGNVATAEREGVQTVYTHSNIQPVYDVFASVQDRDLGSVARSIQNVVRQMQGKLGPADRIEIRGQIASMNQAFGNLTIGLLFAAVFVYALMVVNYQSFLDPLAVLLALPGAGSGLILLLFATGTAFSVPSLMGAIMAIGVASANSILLVTFAREQRQAGMSAFQAALAAGTTRLRPVLMTAAAMMVGMLPMAIGGPGEEQNAALARAVVGGVMIGTMTTLLFVPYLYSVFGKFNRPHAELPEDLTK